jgi:hypothetical protein
MAEPDLPEARTSQAQRRRRHAIMSAVPKRERTRLAVALLAAAVLLAGCGGGSKPSKSKRGSGPRSITGIKAEALKGVPFVWYYPAEFSVVPAQPGLVWVAGIDRLDILDLRVAVQRPLTPHGVVPIMARALAADHGLKLVGRTFGTIRGIPYARFTVTHPSGTTTLTSLLFFFPVAGQTWEFECQSQPAYANAIRGACNVVLNSLRVTSTSARRPR